MATSDRPLLADHTGTWLRGDVLGVLCAGMLNAKVVATPVSSNTALERTERFAQCLRTRIGSPYVIAAMQQAMAEGAQGLICGYEANGGFLLQTDAQVAGRTLSALPTRDAVLPIVAALVAAGSGSVAELVTTLPRRVTYSDRIQEFAPARSKALFDSLLKGETQAARFADIDALFAAFAGPVVALDLTDGLRCTFEAGTVAHLRASGNAPELRCYTEAADEPKARELNALVLGKVSQLTV